MQETLGRDEERKQRKRPRQRDDDKADRELLVLSPGPLAFFLDFCLCGLWRIFGFLYLAFLADVCFWGLWRILGILASGSSSGFSDFCLWGLWRIFGFVPLGPLADFASGASRGFFDLCLWGLWRIFGFCIGGDQENGRGWNNHVLTAQTLCRGVALPHAQQQHHLQT